MVFGAVVLAYGHFPGIISLLLGTFFLWLGLRAWRDPATLGEVLNRDFEKMPKSQPETHVRDKKQ
jgi:threonine/homoserine/homoserine lactone efflux protein